MSMMAGTGGRMVNWTPDAIASRESGNDIGVFRREGRYWTLVLGGQRTCLPDSKGLRSLAILLNEPRRRFYARQLVHLVEAPQESPVGSPIDHTQMRVVNREAALGPQLDERARRQYQSQVESLREQLEDAITCNDSCRAGLLREQLQMFADQLASAFGLGGRDRPAGDCDERARQMIRKNIKAALDAIGETHAGLGRHLTNHVKTGRYCWYDPDPDRPIQWRL
ncbi:MAG: hypothetical protein ACREJO_18030 [Phycisphaerales bacterium]